MKNSSVLTWQLAFTYVGTVIGAGFASGQEILNFFCVFGRQGLLGTLFAGCLFAAFGVMVIYTPAGLQIDNYKKYIIYLFGKKNAAIFDWVITIFLFSGLSVMLIAGGSLMAQVWNYPEWKGFFITAAILYIGILVGAEGVLWLNTVIIPGLIIICVCVAGISIARAETVVFMLKPGSVLVGSNWFFASILYVAYNFVLGAIILVSLSQKAKKACIKGAVLGGLLLGLLAAAICYALQLQGEQVTANELPMLALAVQLHPWAGRLYLFVLWGAILTSALSSGFGLLKRIEGLLPWPKPFLVMGVFLPTLPFLGWPLARAVGIIYPLLGYLGLILIIAIIRKTIKTINQ